MYENAGQFDRAVKKSIKDSSRDPGIAYREMLRDRFLCRVFSEDEPRFLLKGGSSMLARIPDARATKDVDFAARGRETTESAIAALDGLASKDLGDFCTFRLTGWEESLDENGYSRLLKLRYASYVGDEEKDPILIDLSLDCTTTQPAERIAPANRIEIEGVEVCDYLACPLVDQLADKLCAIMELQPGGWPSSRMKDLVDIVTYATNESFDLLQLRQAVRCECAKRGMAVPELHHGLGRAPGVVHAPGLVAHVCLTTVNTTSKPKTKRPERSRSTNAGAVVSRPAMRQAPFSATGSQP